MRPGTVYVIDGSGNADPREADRKRPIYRLDVSVGGITRSLLPEGQSALHFLRAQIDSLQVAKPVLIAADVPIGLPAAPGDVFTAVSADSFLTWLEATEKRLGTSGQRWRDLLIAKGVQA